jgi:hypothetical protein
VVAIGPAGGVGNGAGETSKNENDGMGPTAVSRSGVREAAKTEGITSPLLSLRLRRGGVRAGGTAAVRAAVDESFVTSVRGKASERGREQAASLLPVFPGTLTVDEGETGLTTGGNEGRTSLSALDCLSECTLIPSASIVSRLSEGGAEMTLVTGLSARDCLTSAAAR